MLEVARTIEIIYLPYNGDPAMDWKKLDKKYRTFADAQRVATRMFNTFKADKIICKVAGVEDFHTRIETHGMYC